MEVAEAASTSFALVSDTDIQQLRAAPTTEDQERIFRSLALRCHPDKFTESSQKALATRVFQELLEIRNEARRDTEEHIIDPVCSADDRGCSPLNVVRQRDVVHGLAIDEGGRRVASCGDSGRLMVWTQLGDARSMQEQCELRLEGSIALDTAFLAEDYLAVTTGKCIEIWHLHDIVQTSSATLTGRALALGGNGAHLAVGMETGFVQLCQWCEKHGELQFGDRLSHEPVVEGVAWGIDGQILAAAGGSRITVWRDCHSTWTLCASFELGHICCQLYDINIAGGHCAAGGTGGAAAVWDLRGTVDGLVSEYCSNHKSATVTADDVEDDYAPLFVAKHSTDESVAVNCVGVSLDGRHLASGGSDSRLVLWGIHRQEILRIFYHRLPPGGCFLCTASINALQFVPDGTALMAGGYDGNVTVWSVPQLKSISQYSKPSQTAERHAS